MKEVVWVRTSAIAKALGKDQKLSNSNSLTAKSSVVTTASRPDWDWTRAILLSGVSSNRSIQITIHDDESSEYQNQTIALPPSITQGPSLVFLPANELIENEDDTLPPDDLITLTHLHEPAVVYCLQQRYAQNVIYTATGPILLALNPFKEMPDLYDDNVMGRYWAAGEKVAVDDSTAAAATESLKPHVYRSAHDAFRNMMTAIQDASHDGRDQSLLVRGESGAGKTVTTKHIMKYLATLSQRKAEHAKRQRAPSPGRSETVVPARFALMRRTASSRAQSWKAGALIEEKILESNPILEAFANARTIRNDNSSRFGKFIELQFKHTGSLIGASIETYLLEKVRLIHQQSGERNFHVFYELLAAATPTERKQFYLGDYTARDFKMTCQSQTFDRRDGANDAELFDKLVLAMRTLGFDVAMQTDIFAVATAFLHASNLTFVAVTDDSSKVDDKNAHLEPVLQLLGIEKNDFQSALCEFDIEAGNMSYTRQVNQELAEKGLEAFIKATYGAMFSFIVQSINKKVDCKVKGSVSHGTGKQVAYIGVLDIFGFESFPSNSFEQLCINYCNEALQQQFNLFIFKKEQKEYRNEGIRWEFIEFPDNQDVLDLIDQKHTGILSILTDQCRAPRGSDQSFADAMYKTCGDLRRFEANDLQRGRKQFSILHYAGPVTYDTEGFVEKNKDETPRGATRLLKSSTKEFVQLLGQITEAPTGRPNALSASGRPMKRPTVGSQFKAQLDELRSRVDLTVPHYIRCLKPNQSLKPNQFVKSMIADQLRNAGVLEAIRVSRVGYSQRFPHKVFVGRYGVLSRESADSIGELANAIAELIWKKENKDIAPPSDLVSEVGISVGVQKVFLRQIVYDFLEGLRSEKLAECSVKIQSIARGFLARKQFLGVSEKVVTLQACVRGFLVREQLETQSDAATRIQCAYRCRLARNEVVKLREEEQARELEEQMRKAAIAERKADEVAHVEEEVEGQGEPTVAAAEMEVVRSQLASLKTELENVKAQLQATKEEARATKARVAELETENAKLKQKSEQTLMQEAFTGGIVAEHYSDHADLQTVAKSINGMAFRSKQSKKDLDALVKALAVLR